MHLITVLKFIIILTRKMICALIGWMARCNNLFVAFNEMLRPFSFIVAFSLENFQIKSLRCFSDCLDSWKLLKNVHLCMCMCVTSITLIITIIEHFIFINIAMCCIFLRFMIKHKFPRQYIFGLVFSLIQWKCVTHFIANKWLNHPAIYKFWLNSYLVKIANQTNEWIILLKIPKKMEIYK